MAARTRSLLPKLPKLPKRPIALAAITSHLLLTFVTVVGCSSERDRFDQHLRRGNVALQEPGREETAVIELLNALRINPESAEVSYLIGKARQTQGIIREAIFFYEDALYLDPEHTLSAVALALLQRSSDPKRAAQLLASAREREPRNASIHAARAELALDRENPMAAVRAAKHSIRLDPDFALAYWTLGRAHLGEVRVAQMLEQRADEEDFRNAIAAFERYAELIGPTQAWRSLAERAQVLAAWPGHSKQSLDMFREALAQADQHAPREGVLHVAVQSLEFAREQEQDDLRADLLERLIELEPKHLAYWDELARLRELRGGGGGETLAQLVEEQPENPEAHLRYAGYLQATQGSAAAIEHLVRVSETEGIRPTMLGALVDLYGGAGLLAERNQTLEELANEYPFHEVTLLTRARLAFKRGRVEEAVLDLRDLVKRGSRGETARLLAYAEFALGRYRVSLEAVAQAIRLNPRLESELLELRANAAYSLGECGIAGRTLVQLSSQAKLDDRQRVRLAHCLYLSDRASQGRRLLRKLLARRPPPVPAVLEFARREMDNPAQRELLRHKLEDALTRDPGDDALVLYLAEARLLDGMAREGLEGLERGRRNGARTTPKWILLRARLHARAGNPNKAVLDAGRAVELDPRLHGSLRFYASTLNSLGRHAEAVAALERRQKEGRLDENATALLGNSYLEVGRRDEAYTTLLRAYRMGCRLPDVLNKLAFKLATDGERLELALVMAQDAATQTNESPNALDTLGYVHLKLGDAEAALVYFDRAVEGGTTKGSRLSERALAGFHFRSGLALQTLGRVAEASEAFERAHALNPARPLSPPPRPAVRAQPAAAAADGAPS